MKNKIFEESSLWIFLGIMVALITWVGLAVPLNADEGLYWEHANHLAWGYYTHPPLTGFINYIFTSVFGDNAFALRLPSTLMYAGGVVLVYLLTERMTEDRKTALLAAWIYGCFNVVIVLGVMMTTDCPMLLFFNLSIFAFHEAIVKEKKNYWYLSGVAVGLMILSKMLSVLIFPGLFFFLVFNRDYRKWFLRKEPYLAALIALLIYAPFLIWNAMNDWIHFRFTFEIRTGTENNLVESLSAFFLSLFADLSPVLFFAAIPMMIKLSRKHGLLIRDTFSEESKSLIFMLYILFGGLGFYLALSFKHVVGAHWYSVTLLPFAILLAHYFRKEVLPKYRKGWITASFISLFLFSVPLIAIFMFPTVLPDRLIYIDQIGDDQKTASDVFGWEEGGKKLDEVFAKYSKTYEPLLFSAKDYGIGSLLKFYMPSHPELILFDITDSIHAREYLRWEIGHKKLGANFLFVSDFSDSYERMEPFVKEVKQLDPIVIRDDNGKILRVFYLTLGLDYQGGENSFLHERKS